ncbi:TPA: hypothetical protein ACX6SG_001616 [Photobacterium damselae]
MNNPFESIRKLALSKLSQFKFIMTIVMYLATVIPLLSLGYLMGRTSNDKWLLDLSSLLGSTGSLLGGLATVFAAWVAFGAYGAWKKQITHPEMFKNDMYIMENLNEIHTKISGALEFIGDDIVYYYKSYIVECNYLNLHGEITIEKEDEIKNKHLKRLELYNSDLKRFGMNVELINLIQDVLSKSKLPYEHETVLYKEVLKYFSLARDILNQLDNMCSLMELNEQYFNRKVNADDFKVDGILYQELNNTFKTIKFTINEKWGI